MDRSIPFEAVIRKIKKETRDVFTLTLWIKDRAVRKNYRFTPGQFNMLSVPGIGECAISISSASWREHIKHTIRVAGDVTTALSALKIGQSIGLRGPFGRGWPMEKLKGRDIMIIAGGIGIAPFRSLIRQIISEKDAESGCFVLYGAKSPKDIIYKNELPLWAEIINLSVTVDKADPEEHWAGDIGLVTNLFKKIEITPERTIALICGPEIMMKASLGELISKGIPEDSIYLSLERHMNCAMGICGHCMLGPRYVCRDGPVFPYPEIKRFFGITEV